MAELRCPMCGKDNPDHLEECQFCQARLTPLNLGKAETPPPDESSDGADDWLMSFRADDSSNPDAADIPDWLRDLGDEETPDEEDPDADTSSYDAPDWLSRLDSEDETGPDAETSSYDAPDWLNELTGDDEAEREDDPDADTSSYDEPDWMSELTGVDEAESEDVHPDADTSPYDRPAALQNLAEDDAEPSMAAEATEDVRPEADEPLSVDKAEAITRPVPDETELLSWINKVDIVENLSETVEGDDEDIPDWLSDLAPVDDAAVSDSGLDWLSELGEGEEEATEEELESLLESSAEGHIPDWLGDLDMGEDEIPAEAADLSLNELEEEEAPDWLNEFDEPEAVAAEAEAPPGIEMPAAVSDDDELPGWLTGMQDDEEPAAEAGAPDRPAEQAEILQSAAPDAAEESDELPEWLTDLTGEDTETADIAPVESAFPAEEAPAEVLSDRDQARDEEEIPDWLAEIPDVDQVDAVSESGGLPDWLVEMQSDDDAAPQEAAPQEAAPEEDVEPVEESADWIAEQVEVLQSETKQVADEEGDDLPEWLTDLTGEEDVAAVQEELQAAFSEADEESDEAFEAVELPEWLADAPAEAEAPDALEAEAASDEMPDWLTDLSEEEEAEVETVEAAADEAGLPDWLLDSASDDADEEETEDEPDWLTDLSQGAVVAAAADAIPDEVEEAPEGEAQPAWLSELAGVEDTAEEEDIPDWLNEFSKDVDEEAAPSRLTEEEQSWHAGFISREEAEDQQLSHEDFPDWLEEMPQIEIKDKADLDDADEEAAEELPDWLGEFEGVEGEPQATEEEEDLPEWLSSAIGPESEYAEDEAPVTSAPVEEELAPDLEEWLEMLGAEAVVSESAAVADESEDAEPEWLSGFEAETEEPLPEAESEDFPDWLQDLSAQSIGEVEVSGEAWSPTSSTEPADEEDLSEPDAVDWMPEEEDALSIDMLASGEGIEEGSAMGELPDWLKAMRPHEATTPGMMEAGEVDEGAIERIGPLAGLRGVLSAEPSATQAGQSPGQFVRLQISNAQQLKADELQRMVSSETSPTPARRAPILSEQRVLRYIIALVLFLAVALPLFLPGNLVPLPSKPPEMGRIDMMIGGLPLDSQVLVVLDYQPGMSGEMDAAASAVLDHLMLQQPRLALVSTQLTGPALGERLIRDVERQHRYVPGTQYVNLGYLPGDSTGLQLFAKDPRTAFQLAYDNRPLWSLLDRQSNNPWAQPALEGIDSLDDFALTLLISDDADTVRRWIEQVVPTLSPATFIVVASAQAEPLVRPYFEAPQQQVVSLVPGLAGGAAYEGLLQREGPARAAWDAQSLGSLAAILLILGAGTYNLYLLLKERDAARKGRS